ncbi:hypothetical protein ACFO4L_04555 [Bacillus daqingensis]|uniref:Uncharacterized protein n=1 Tax=Bacillus daqingensis TaxID=872396 RepID=A0ABV9NU70_9BACI
MIDKTSPDDITADMLHGFFAGWPEAPDTKTHWRILQDSWKAFIAYDET